MVFCLQEGRQTPSLQNNLQCMLLCLKKTKSVSCLLRVESCFLKYYDPLCSEWVDEVVSGVKCIDLKFSFDR